MRMRVSGTKPRAGAGVVAAVLVLTLAHPGRGLSYGSPGNTATIHGSSGVYGRDSGYLGRSSSHYSSYGGYSPSSGSADEVQKETKYYYGGKYQGSCVTDGLYYRDDTTFIICSNGYPHEQPCPPGTKTSGSPRYQPGYYYGYTDLCSVNLVDYGYGPEYYAPRGYPYLAPEHRDRGRAGSARSPLAGSQSGGSHGRAGRPVSGAGGGSSYSGGASSSVSGTHDHSLESYGEFTYGVSSSGKSRASPASEYSGSSGGSSGGFSNKDSLSSAYQRDTSSSRLTYQDVKSPYLRDSGAGSKLNARSDYYGRSSNYGGGYDTSFKSRDSPYSSSSTAGKQYR